MTPRRFPPLLLPGLLLAAYLAAPLAAGVLAIPGGDWGHADWNGVGRATAVSALTATAATLAVALGGVPLGFLLARRRGPSWAVLGTVVQLPLALPPLGSGILLLLLLGPDSALTDTLAGIVLAQVFVASPFGIIAARSAFGASGTLAEDVAATLGHRPGAVFVRVSLRLAARPIAAGLLLAWLRAFGEFGATVLVSYHPQSLPVFTFVQFGAAGLPALLPVLVPILGAAALATTGAALLARTKRGRDGGNALPAPAPFPSLPGTEAPPAFPPRPLRLRATARAGSFTLALDWRAERRLIAVLGPSGSGKSLTLRVLAGLASAGRDGAVRLGDLDLGALAADRRPVGWVPQGNGLLPGLSVARQIRFSPGAAEDEAKRWTERFGLAALAGRDPATLSGGEAQRVALARALARPGTRLLLLDEPFSALDAPLRARLRAETLRFAEEIDATVILVTHDPDEALGFADEVLLLDAGRVLQSGPAETVFRRPRSGRAALLLGAPPRVGTGTVDGSGRIAIGGGLTLDAGILPLPPVGSAVRWAVRPSQVRLAAREGGDTHEAVIVWRDAGPRGGRLRLCLGIGDATVEALVDPGTVPGGDAVRVRIDPEALQVWAAPFPRAPFPRALSVYAPPVNAPPVNAPSGASLPDQLRGGGTGLS